MSSLNIALSKISDTHLSVYTFGSASTSSFLLHFSFIRGESDHVSYMTDKSSCPICKVKSCLGSYLCRAHCSRIHPCFYLLSWFHHYPIWLLLVSAFPYSVPSHSCDPLEGLFPSSSQHNFSSTLPEDEDLEFWQWYLRIHFHHWWTPLIQLSISPIDWQSVESFPCSISTHLFTWLGLHWSLWILMKTLGSHL